MKNEFPEYKYNGHTYKPWKETEYDSHGEAENTKIFHTVDHPDGIVKIIDWSPYRVPTIDEFKLWVDLGYPDRNDFAFGKREVSFPLNAHDLQTIHNFRFNTADGRGL